MTHALNNEQLTNINKTLLKQRDEAELKVSQLVALIEDECFGTVPMADWEKIIKQLKKIGV